VTVPPGSENTETGEPTPLWLEAHAACNGNRDDMWDWLAARLQQTEQERDVAREAHDNALAEYMKLEARAEAAEKALREIEACEWQQATVVDLVAIARAYFAAQEKP
jgi:hypothetical protein